MKTKIPNIPWIWSCNHCSKEHNWNYWYGEPLGITFACGCDCGETTIVHQIKKGVWKSLKTTYHKKIPPTLFIPVVLEREKKV